MSIFLPFIQFAQFIVPYHSTEADDEMHSGSLATQLQKNKCHLMGQLFYNSTGYVVL
jgi:hypothetical protein